MIFSSLKRTLCSKLLFFPSSKADFFLYWGRGLSFSENKPVEMAVTLGSVALHCYRRCARPLHSSLEGKQRKSPLRHLWSRALFHRQRSCPQLDLTSFQADELEKTGIIPSPQLSLCMVTGQRQGFIQVHSPPYPPSFHPQRTAIPTGFFASVQASACSVRYFKKGRACGQWLFSVLGQHISPGGTGAPQLHVCPCILPHQALPAACHAGTARIQEISGTFA